MKKEKIIKNEKELIKELNCNELCAITKKKETNPQLKNKKLLNLAKNKMQDNECPIC